MKIGFCYDLKRDYLALGFSEEDALEFDSPVTIDGLAGAIAACGHEVDRIGNVRGLVERLAAGDRWDLVFTIAEGVSGYGREAQVAALLDAYGIPYTFSDPLVCALTLHKGMTKHVLRDRGIPTPPFAVIERAEGLDAQLAGLGLEYPVFAKPVAEGTSKGIGPDARADDPQALRGLVERLLQRFRQPVLVEGYLSGRECTVGILGTGERARALLPMEVLLQPGADQGIYTWGNKENWQGRVQYRLVGTAGARVTPTPEVGQHMPPAPLFEDDAFAREAMDLALRTWRTLGCRDGGRVDLRADGAGRLHVLEVNPLPGLNPHHSDLPILAANQGTPFRDLVAQILESALRRVPGPRGEALAARPPALAAR